MWIKHNILFVYNYIIQMGIKGIICFVILVLTITLICFIAYCAIKHLQVIFSINPETKTSILKSQNIDIDDLIAIIDRRIKKFDKNQKE